ncbi:MAG: hypothetical protein HQM14_01365 [SAR324 cluster bacterium]|nr:hypothetical protein [SAR324 cluster bacterium]
MKSNDSNHHKATFLARMQYGFDNFMAKGGLSVFLALLVMFFCTFALMFGLRWVASFVLPDETIAQITDQMWRVFLQISDAGAIADDANANYVNKIIGIVTILLGLVFFSSLVAFITSVFEEKITQLRKGKSPVIEEGHTLILGFGNRVLEIIRELIIANESEKDVAIVVLSEKDKEEMDDFFNDNLDELHTTRIVTRSGNTSNLQSLRKMGIRQCKSIIILNSASPADSYRVKYIGDARVLKTIMAVGSVTGSTGMPPVVLELFFSRNRKLAENAVPGQITALDANYLLAKMLVQTSRNQGLAFVYSQLVGFEGDEIYIFQPKGDDWCQHTFAELQWHFKKSVLLGFRKGRQIFLNPQPDYKPSEEDEMIVLAEDDSAITYYKKPVIQPAKHKYGRGHLKNKPERQMIIGWSDKTPLLVDEYAQYVVRGSTIDVVVTNVTKPMNDLLEMAKKKYPNLTIRLIKANIHNPAVLKRLSPQKYNNVIILAENSDNEEEVDAETIAKLLELRHYFRSFERATGQTPEAQLITEVMDSQNAELIFNTGVKDFLIPNQFISKIFAQISEEPDVKLIYEDLFSEDGSELYLKPITLYFQEFPLTITFADCMLAAQNRSEVCIGVRLDSEKQYASEAYGIHLIPEKDTVFEFNEYDVLIVLAEDDT